ncbi:MAG TPA: hypothetical protein H9848_02495 [Candidatus Parabacteroides intestinigallinarum]|uniref:Uncharacterized protein n=1 Tax=Candidatus Parabacteroides intestinigallinarum TaxID=2838722 RepID=A0A9D1XQ13_9BACT|nr:hypothetical protein [Candidatus Parabacteroides intestinigallinarum]
MSANTAKVQALIENAFVAAIDKLTKEESGNFVTDLYVQVDAESGELQIYDDAERLMEKVVIFEWVDSLDKEKEETFNKQVAASIKAVLTILSTKKVFDAPCLARPFSVSLTDEDFVVIEELLFIDDELLRLDDPLLKDLDADLDNFLSDLLADVK